MQQDPLIDLISEAEKRGLSAGDVLHDSLEKALSENLVDPGLGYEELTARLANAAISAPNACAQTIRCAVGIADGASLGSATPANVSVASVEGYLSACAKSLATEDAVETMGELLNPGAHAATEWQRTYSEAFGAGALMAQTTGALCAAAFKEGLTRAMDAEEPEIAHAGSETMARFAAAHSLEGESGNQICASILSAYGERILDTSAAPRWDYVATAVIAATKGAGGHMSLLEAYDRVSNARAAKQALRSGPLMAEFMKRTKDPAGDFAMLATVTEKDPAAPTMSAHAKLAVATELVSRVGEERAQAILAETSAASGIKPAECQKWQEAIRTAGQRLAPESENQHKRRRGIAA